MWNTKKPLTDIPQHVNQRISISHFCTSNKNVPCLNIYGPQILTGEGTAEFPPSAVNGDKGLATNHRAWFNLLRNC